MYEQRYPEVDDVVMVQARARARRPCFLGLDRQPPRLAGCGRLLFRLPARADSQPAWVSQVKSIAEMGAYVSLLEYNNIEGMILLSELSRRRIRSVTKLIKARAPAANPAGETPTRRAGGPPASPRGATA
jgi:hypothetical protein